MNELRSGRRVGIVATVVGLLTPVAITLAAAPAAAAFLSVTDGGDTGLATQFRQVVAAAAPGDTITFTVPTVTLVLGEILINKNLTVRGGHGMAGLTTVTRFVQAAPFRIFHVTAGVTATLDLLSVTGGLTTTEPGAGIYNEGTLRVTRSTVQSNSASGGVNALHGGGIASAATGDLSVVNSTITVNSVTSTSTGLSYGGGISGVGGPISVINSQVSSNTVSAPSAQGGGIAGVSPTVTASTVTVLDSSVQGNTLTSTGAFAQGGGVVASRQPLSMSNSVVYGNAAQVTAGTGAAQGGGVAVAFANATIDRTEFAFNSALAATPPSMGGGLSGVAGVITVTNSTLYSNVASEGGAVYNGGTLTLSFTTVADNSTDPLGGAAIGNNAGPLTLANSIAANGATTNCSGTITETGANDIFGTNGTCTGSITTDPQLSAPTLNGGVSRTMALGATSPAANAAAFCPPALVDQRGFSRPAEGACDLGAYEQSATLPDATLPVCAVVGRLATNPRQMDVSARDLGRGLQTITNVNVTNGQVIVPYFTPGSTLLVVLAAVKDDQAMSTTWTFQANDQAGNAKFCG